MSGAPSRREIRRQDRRKAILLAARSSFMDNGYAATSMSAIAAELGGSKTTLWAYFPSKEELFSAVLEEEIGRFRAALLATLELHGSLEDTLTRFCTALLAKIGAPDSIRLHRIVAAEAGRFPELGRIFYERAPRQTQQRLAAFLDSAMQRGELRGANPLLAAQQLLALLQARLYTFRLWNVGEAVDLDSDVAAAVDTFLRAYAPDRP
ncbi:MAG: TetR/AcrR family transcriptional regulator [Alphaproteobacteria bacterium]|nr:TetR/AcrR family transcriptional regulator [Alphaproteobacteria bacterium]